MKFNLYQMIGAPTRVNCPKCHNTTKTGLNDFDCTVLPHDQYARWRLPIRCEHCGHEFVFSGKVGFLTASFESKA